MRDAAGDAELVGHWLAVAAAAATAEPRLTGPLGYAGFSMGALYGLSIVADLPDVRAAMFALGGVIDDRRAARNAKVRDGASRLGDREVLMCNMTRDEHFPIVGAIDVFREHIRTRNQVRCTYCSPDRSDASGRARSNP